ncbi:MAG: 2-oxoacid:acceptor oxidoreductase family protein [Deltaproteobacteria bacterium]|nr:2-oxoacid:acceptor oxidoreductase family protein [Deltaproteobacteria bacterium]
MNRNYVLAGVGGQGILFITRILHDAVLKEGHHVLVSETHGMAQRGGSVVSHVRVGSMQSPLVRAGTADGLLVFEADELPNTVSFLKPGGAAVVNGPDSARMPFQLSEYLKQLPAELHVLDASRIALETGAPLTANMILLGFSIERLAFPFSYEAVEDTVRNLSREPYREQNLKALASGYEAGSLGEKR